MTDEQKVYIRGVDGRENEVRQALINLGGRNVHDFYYGDSEGFFYITHDGEIRFAQESSEIGKIIIDNYYEIKLPELWKDGDILYSNDLREYVICSDNSNKWGEQIAYITISQGGSITTFESFLARSYHLATSEEIEQFHKILHNLGKDWDAEKKEIVKWKWKPNKEDYYYYISSVGKVIRTTYLDTDFDKSSFDFGNCFCTKEEAEAMAEKIKNLLKDNL